MEIKTKSQVTLYRDLIAKETDQAKLPGLYDELFAAVKSETRAEIEAEAIKQADEKIRNEAQAAGVKLPEVKTTEAGDFMGWSIKKAVAGFRGSKLLSKHAKEIEDKEVLERTIVYLAGLAIRAGVDAKAGYNPGMAVVKANYNETDANGGYLTPTEQRFEILAYTRDVSVALQKCRHIPMTSDSMTIPVESTKVSIGITAETVDATATSGIFGQATLTAKRHDATCLVSNELLNDNAVPGGFLAFLMEQMVEALGQKIDSAVFKGTGDPVSGIFVKYGYSQVFSTGSTNFSALLEADIRALIAKVPGRYFPGMEWYTGHASLWNYIYGLKDSQERLLFVPDMVSGGSGKLWGKPVNTPSMAIDTSAVSTAMLVLADLGKGFIIGDRLTDMTFFIDPYSSSKSYQTNVHFFTRWAYCNALSNLFAAIATPAS